MQGMIGEIASLIQINVNYFIEIHGFCELCGNTG
ncbi:protein of unknown function [Serratia sp. Tan611]|nr:protein of unknown function [Serratia sp. Tan611]